jgi:formylglycine-generating enzyme required for sulfatase activity/tRNA A-37 threonylcarbamoyl transferase component Bud32
MPVATVAEFIDALQQYQLVDPARLGELDEHMYRGDTGPGALAEALVRWGWLTPFQAESVLAGRGRELNVGPYLLLARLGKGGMGEVFRARQQRLDREVALKVIRSDEFKQPAAVKRFQLEGRAAAQLKHPNVVTIYDAHEAGDAFYISMEYVEGTDLSRLVKRDGPLPVATACEYARQAALGLQHAHENGLVHRDIKPSNLIVTPAARDDRGTVKILDFGLARSVGALTDDGSLTPTDQWLGTPEYISPEQAQNSKEVDIRADIFSLGCTLYFLLTGRSAFSGNTRMEKLVARLSSTAAPASSVRPEVPRRLDRLLSLMLARDPDKRFQTPAEVAKALEPFCRGELPADAEDEVLMPSVADGNQATVTAAARIQGERNRLPLLRREDSGPTPPMTPPTPTSVLPPPQTQWRQVGLAIGVMLFTAFLGVFIFRPKTPPAPPGPAESFVNSIGMKMMLIPAGRFLMGAPPNEPEHGEDEVPQHEVEIKKPFYLGAFEVTQGEYRALMDVNPSQFSPLGAGAAKLGGIADTSKYPVDSVSWEDAREFCRRLTAREKLGFVYRLPTEAEWEYACRAKTTTPFYFGSRISAADANFDGRSPYGGAPPGAAYEATRPVGSYPPNAFGLFDMYGNVFEWCQDHYVEYSIKLQPGGSGKGNGPRVMRGGAWLSRGADCRSAKRHQSEQDFKDNFVGFRVACEP